MTAQPAPRWWSCVCGVMWKDTHPAPCWSCGGDASPAWQPRMTSQHAALLNRP